MKYSRSNRLGALALVSLLIVACGDKYGNSHHKLAASALPSTGKPTPGSPQEQDNTPPVNPPSTNTPPGGSPAVNQRPTISGTAPTEATVGQLWTFRPTLTDPDGDSLNLSATSLPGWMKLDKNNGVLSGTPTDADVQTWSGITVTVNDGEAWSNLPAFTVNVLAPNAASGSVTLSWLPPTERLDGAPVGELSGYRLLYGQTSGEYSETIAINNPGITSYMIEGLTSGDWYFAIQTVDIGGLISPPSVEASTSI